MTMRVLVAGIIGAAASAAAWFFAEYITSHEMGWLAIAVGLITGLCISAAAGAGAAESYGRGALAVVLTMVAMVGGRFVYAQVMQNVSKVSTLAPAAQNADDVAEDAAPAAEGEGAVAVAEPEQRAEGPARTPAGNVRLAKPTASTYEDMNMIWMAAAALAAYFTGKGSGKAPPVVSHDEQAPPEGAAGTPA